jgi:hypothetical protein
MAVPRRNTHTARYDTEMPADSGGRTGITFRAMALGVFFVAITCFIVCYAELIIGRIQIGFLQMPPAAIGIFFFLVLLNRGMQRVRRRFGLSAAELLMIYCMMLVAAMISSRGVLEKIIPVLVTPIYFANPANRWQNLYFPYIKKWMVAFDPQGGLNQPVATDFFERLREGHSIPWGLWAIPLAAWGALVLLILFAFLCLASILRKQWVDNEKLTFPLAQLPLELLGQEQGRSIFTNRLFWGGVAQSDPRHSADSARHIRQRFLREPAVEPNLLHVAVPVIRGNRVLLLPALGHDLRDLVFRDIRAPAGSGRRSVRDGA